MLTFQIEISDTKDLEQYLKRLNQCVLNLEKMELEIIDFTKNIRLVVNPIHSKTMREVNRINATFNLDASLIVSKVGSKRLLLIKKLF